MRMDKLYVVRKFIFARSVKEVLKKDPRVKPDEVFISEDWFKNDGFIQEKGKMGLKV